MLMCSAMAFYEVVSMGQPKWQRKTELPRERNLEKKLAANECADDF